MCTGLAEVLLARQDFRYRSLLLEDATSLGRLMFEAYSGTVDDEGECLEDAIDEANGTLGGKYGEMIWGSSFVIDDGQDLLSACVVTLFEHEPLLAFSVTHPCFQRQGMAEFLIKAASINLLSLGYTKLNLYVTLANTPALSLYKKLRFIPVSESR